MTHRIKSLAGYLSISLASAMTLALLAGTLPLSAGDGSDGPGGTFGAALAGSQEVPPVPTGGSGEFELTIVNSNTWLYVLSYRGIEGGDPTAAHIHISPPGVNGPVVIFLCGGGGKPACPTAGSVSGTITPENVAAQADLGVAAGDLDAVLTAMRAGNTYANVHNAQNPGGHIRGLISGG